MRTAWLDETFHDRMRLYRTFVLTKDARWLRALSLTAWKYVICFSVPEFRFYLRLRFGSHLSVEEQNLPHTIALLAHPVLYSNVAEFQNTTSATSPRALRDTLVNDLRTLGAPAHEPIFRLSGSSLSVYPSTRANGVAATAFRQLFSVPAFWMWQASLAPGPTSLTLVAGLPFAGEDEDDGWTYSYSSMINLSVAPPKHEFSWGARYTRLHKFYPCLKALTLMSPPTDIQSFLPHLSDTLENLRIEIEIDMPGASHGSIHSWNIIAAFRQGFKIGTRGISPQLTLLTGPEVPTGWSDAVRVAAETGVRLSREIDTVSERRARRWV
jgi:hypothetical protein